ncbi:MAG: hypothetical protein AB4352_20960 [Hormoscilla sp.]
MTKSRSLKGKGSALIAQKDLFSARKGSSIAEKRIFDRREKDLRSARKISSLIASKDLLSPGNSSGKRIFWVRLRSPLIVSRPY